MAVFPSVAFLIVLYVINKERGPGASLKSFAFAATAALALTGIVLALPRGFPLALTSLAA
jgi:hypothetical protein